MTLVPLHDILAGLFKDAPSPLRLPEKLTIYGGPADDFQRIVEHYRLDEEGTVHIDRSVQYKKPIEYISIKATVEDVVE
jgi:hypothetical protein